MAKPSYVGKKGWIASVTEKGVEWVPWWKSMSPGTGPNRPFRPVKYAVAENEEHKEAAAARGAEYSFDKMGTLPRLKRRTPQERIESLTKRLIDAWRENPRIAEAILVEIQGEYWKQGTPVTAEALRGAASESLRDAERRKV